MIVKKLISKKRFSLLLDFIGFFCLASFLSITPFLSFLVEVLPGCYYSGQMIIQVKCDNSVWGGFLSLYLMFFSPIVIAAAVLMGYGLFVSLFHFEILQFFWILFLIGVLLLSVFTSFRFIYRTGKTLVVHKKSLIKDKESRIALIMLVLVFLPAISVFAYRAYLIPPESSNRFVKMNLWHDKFSVPRKYLKKWPLVDKEKPEVEPSGFWVIINRSAYPFAQFEIPYDALEIQNKGALAVTLRPHYKAFSDKEIFDHRNDFFEKQKKKTHYRDKSSKPVYDMPPEKSGNWLIYYAHQIKDRNSIEHDIYLFKNSEGEITNILQCMPDTWCKKEVTRKNNTYQYYAQCKDEQECKTCKRTCTDNSNTNKYYVSYAFDKNELDSYFEMRKSILEFILSFAVTKE
ncbi:MAG: hypothetical protein OEY94_00030 [Alphaproteobacteria bacterium]|nr:hypothetical protein [Alphaproteobacteria bacterium]